MTNIQKFILTTGAICCALALVTYGCSPAHASDQQEDYCATLGAGVTGMIELRKAGWSRERIDQLHGEPEMAGITDFVFRLNDEGLNKGKVLGDLLEASCRLNDEAETGVPYAN